MERSTKEHQIIYLSVPYKSKDTAKKLGAKWNP
jgi:hypothetical protein